MRTPGTSDAAPVRLAAAAAAVFVIAEALAVPAVLATSAALVVAGRATRWRPHWLGLPAALAACWLLGGRAHPASLRQLSAQAGRTASAALAAASRPVRLPRFAALAASQWRPPELAVVALLAAAQAGAILWLDWRRRGRQGWRPGAVAALRRRWATTALRGGQTTTVGGCGIGFDASTGKLIEISWAEAERGVLAIGQCGAAPAPVMLSIVCAAVRRRKAVLVLDLATECDAAAADGAAGSWLSATALALASRLGQPVAGPLSLGSCDDNAGITRLLGLAVRGRHLAVAAAREPAAAVQAIAALTGLLHGLRRRGLRGDTLVCVTGGEQADPDSLAGLVRASQDTGTSVLVLTVNQPHWHLRAAAGLVITGGADGGFTVTRAGGPATPGVAVPVDLAALRRTAPDSGQRARTRVRVSARRSGTDRMARPQAAGR